MQDKSKTKVFEVPYYECNLCNRNSTDSNRIDTCRKLACRAKKVGIQRTTVEVIYTQKRS